MMDFFRTNGCAETFHGSIRTIPLSNPGWHYLKHASGEIPILTAAQRGGRFTKKMDGEPKDSPGNSKAIQEQVLCDECTEIFQTVSSAIQHKHKKHQKSVIKHYCGYCGMQFPLKYCLDKHVLTHPKAESPSKSNYICLTCNFSFNNGTALDYHKKNVHNRVTLSEKIETPPASNKIKQMQGKDYYQVYYCHLCGCEYVVKYNLERHLGSQHTVEEREALPSELVKCEICDAIFFCKKAYENHLISHKEDDLIVPDPEERAKLVRMDLDYDPSRVQSTVDRYLSKEVNRNRRKAVVSEPPARVSKVAKVESESETVSLSRGKKTAVKSTNVTGKQPSKKNE